MAKTVCKSCGHKNPASAAVCSNCGSFLFDEPQQPQQTVTGTVTEQNFQQEDDTQEPITPEIVEAKQETGREETILVKGGNSSQWIGMASAFGILLIFVVLEYIGISMPSYSIYLFLAMIFILPSALRRLGASVKFTPTDFLVPGENGNVTTFAYDDIMNVKLGSYNRASQKLTIFFKDEKPGIILDFHSFTNFRSVVMMLSRRHIPVSRGDMQSASQAAGQP